MSLICPKASCRAKPGMCVHDKLLGVLVLVLAAILLLRRPL